jgi:hypothetical protein
MFTAEEARKLAKEVKENKNYEAIKLAETYVVSVLEHIKEVIKDSKDYVVRDVGGYDDITINQIINRFRELGFDVGYKKDERCETITISWSEKEEKMIYVKTGKDENHEKVVSDLIKSLKKDKQYFEHKPVYWFHEKFPTEFFL